VELILISLFRNVLPQTGAPEDLIQIIEEPTSELTVGINESSGCCGLDRSGRNSKVSLQQR
jgi:hypothetical protein